MKRLVKKGYVNALARIILILPFFLALFSAFFSKALFPQSSLIAFAPFLAILYQRKSFLSSLWISFFCGILVDLLTSEFRIGIFGINYLVTTVLCYRQKRHFFEDHLFTLSLFTVLISFVSSLLHLCSLQFMGHGLPISGKLVFLDLFLGPVWDGFYTFIWFTFPLNIYSYVRKIGWRRFFFNS